MNGQSLGNGFIEFHTVEQATDALNELNGHEVEYGVKLNLNYARPKRSQQGGRSYGGDWGGGRKSTGYGGQGGGYQRDGGRGGSWGRGGGQSSGRGRGGY